MLAADLKTQSSKRTVLSIFTNAAQTAFTATCYCTLFLLESSVYHSSQGFLILHSRDRTPYLKTKNIRAWAPSQVKVIQLHTIITVQTVMYTGGWPPGIRTP